jgi:hypothetical protein
VTADPVGRPDDLAFIELEALTLLDLAGGRPTTWIVQHRDVTRLWVKQLAGQYPDRRARQARAARLNAVARRLRDDAPAAAACRGLTLAVRDRDVATIAAYAARATRVELLELALLQAAVIGPDTDLHQALETLDLPPGEWSDATVSREAARYTRDRARDQTAVAAWREANVRRGAADARPCPAPPSWRSCSVLAGPLHRRQASALTGQVN